MAVETAHMANIIATVTATTPPTARSGGFRHHAQMADLRSDMAADTRRFVVLPGPISASVGSQGTDVEALDYEGTVTVKVAYVLADMTSGEIGRIIEDQRVIKRALEAASGYAPATTGVYRRSVACDIDLPREVPGHAVSILTVTYEYRA